MMIGRRRNIWLAIAIGAMLAACKSSTAPQPAEFTGAWVGKAKSMIDTVTATISLSVVRTSPWTLSPSAFQITGAGRFGNQPFTVIDGMQETGVYGGQPFNNISFRVTSPVLGIADVSGSLDGSTFTGSIGAWSLVTPARAYTLTLAHD